MVFHDFGSKFNLQQKWTSFEHSIHADHNGASPTPLSHS